MAKTRTSSAVKKRYNDKAYDRLGVTIPKGRKADVEAYAEARGGSVNGLINDLLRGELGMTDRQWRARAEEKTAGEA